MPVELPLLEAMFRAVDAGAKIWGSVTAGHLATLCALARMTRGPIVECGVGGGFTTIALLAGAADRGIKVTSYDTNLGCEVRVRAQVLLEPDQWTFKAKSSVNAASDWADGSVGLWFLDTTHTLEMTKLELSTWLPKMRADGVMCGHDYLLEGFGVKQAVEEFMAANPDRFRLQIFEHDLGFFILWPQ